jgi:hypothetical protein
MAMSLVIVYRIGRLDGRRDVRAEQEREKQAKIQAWEREFLAMRTAHVNGVQLYSRQAIERLGTPSLWVDSQLQRSYNEACAWVYEKEHGLA